MKKRRTAKELIAIWEDVKNGVTWCAVEECEQEANVYLYSGEAGDVYMCPKHAAEELDRD